MVWSRIQHCSLSEWRIHPQIEVIYAPHNIRLLSQWQPTKLAHWDDANWRRDYIHPCYMSLYMSWQGHQFDERGPRVSRSVPRGLLYCNCDWNGAGHLKKYMTVIIIIWLANIFRKYLFAFILFTITEILRVIVIHPVSERLYDQLKYYFYHHSFS